MQDIINEADIWADGRAVVKFYAEWCAPCKRIDSILKKMEKEFPDIVIYTIDVEKLPALAQRHKIMSLPTLIFFDLGKEIERIVGVALTDQLRKSFSNLNK